MIRRHVRWVHRALDMGQVACLAWLVTTVVQLLLAEPALADNCSVFTDCFGQANSAAEATFGLALLSGLSLLLDFVPVIGDVKGVVEGVTGRDLLTGEELSPWERALGMIPLLPFTDALRAAGKVDEVAGLVGRADGGLDAVASAGRHGDEAGGVVGGGRHADDAAGPTPAAGGAEPPRRGGGDPPPRSGDEPPRDGGFDGEGYSDADVARLTELARDPAHGGRITEGSRQEARVALDLDSSGRLPGLERSAQPEADFVDPSGQLWDVKGYNSAYANGYDLDRAMVTVNESIRGGENVILDTTKMSPTHIDELRAAVGARPEWAGKIVWWP